jgi:parallel beta-helix repeat protein
VRIGEEAMNKDEAGESFKNRITDCTIHDIGRTFPSAVGIWIGHSPDNLIAHNEIFDTFYSGISVGWTWGYETSLNRGNVVEFNRVHYIGKRADGDGPILSDMGGVYVLGGREGTVVRNNIFHDIDAIKYGGWGIYLDEGCSEVLIENNLTHHTKYGGFHLHYGRENVIRNNIFALGVEQQVMRSREEEHLSLTFENNVVYWSEGQLTKGGPKNVKFNKNLYGPIAAEKFMAGVWNLEQWRAEGQDKETIFADPQFVDPAKGDFSYPPTSPAAEVLKPFDLSTAGVRAK